MCTIDNAGYQNAPVCAGYSVINEEWWHTGGCVGVKLNEIFKRSLMRNAWVKFEARLEFRSAA